MGLRRGEAGTDADGVHAGWPDGRFLYTFQQAASGCENRRSTRHEVDRATSRRIEALSERRTTAAAERSTYCCRYLTPVAAVIYHPLNGNLVVSTRELAFSCTLHTPRGR